MTEYHRVYPQYNFLSHKGYGTEEHLRHLAAYGPCPIHRKSFAPIADLMNRFPNQPQGKIKPRESAWTIA
jgi:ribonuclease HII